jgi:UDP-galactopyranose mutase
MSKFKHDYLIVGAGFFGSVLAERIANDLGARVLVIEKRPHIGGNCYSETDQKTGIQTHKYGTHIFHTSSKKVWDYINQFTEFNNYHHQVLTVHKNKVYQMPINLRTINTFYNLNLSPQEAKSFLKSEIRKSNIKNPKNLEEKSISLIGRPLYEAFIKSYTIKQWGKDPKDLPAGIITRIPVRYSYCNDYFVNSKWQGIPLNGYTNLFERLLDSPKITVKLNVDYLKNRNLHNGHKLTIYTGPIDQFFDYRYGKLEWRTVRFNRKLLPVESFQGTAVMNYADNNVAYTRIHEFRHLHPERAYTKKSTIIHIETPANDTRSPYYPINSEKNQHLYKKYKKLALQTNGFIFGGRLGDYAYYDMDQTILAALTCYQKKIQH